MKYSLKVWLLGHFYHSACKAELKRQGVRNVVIWNIVQEYKKITFHAKNIGASNMLSAYIMAIYFIALNRSTGLSPEENYEIFKDGLYESKLFHKALGNADSYLSQKKLPERLKWSEESHKRKYENDWGGGCSARQRRIRSRL